ncbi:DUF7511 domain-containing protein [Natrinema salifodinae]|uniref:DUF7511 domain-containing protein n=1 Tax=Natrinema salifodinae TaxID=1202768 RepID=A0A1I0NA95_9EURY|nr:hypothetical protein [Natrinema salifodinae]SEV97806.1 hypothetical protein SAMN05216285_1475 [Natrinema salifodinae]
MTVNEASPSDEVQSGAAPLELLADKGDDGVWTAVPANATGDERVSKWLEIDADAVCDLDTWR